MNIVPFGDWESLVKSHHGRPAGCDEQTQNQEQDNSRRPEPVQTEHCRAQGSDCEGCQDE